MIEFTKGFLFNPDQDIQQYIPVLLSVGSLVIFIVMVWLANNIVRIVSTERKNWKRFQEAGTKYGLTANEISFLKRLTKLKNVHRPSRIYVDETLFESVMKVKEKRAEPREKRLIGSIRHKLFDRTLLPNKVYNNTRELKAGIPVLVKSMDVYEDPLVGELYSVSTNGLSIVFSASANRYVLFEKNNQVEIITDAADNKKLRFTSWIKDIIPGERKRIVVGHSSFIEEQQRGRASVPQPQKESPVELPKPLLREPVPPKGTARI